MPFLQRKAYGCALPEECCADIDSDERFGIMGDWARQRWRMASIDERRRMANISANNGCPCEGERKGLLRGHM